MATVLVNESFNGASSNTNLESFTANNNWSRVGGATNGWVVQTSGLLRCNPQTGDGYISDGTTNQGGFIEFTLSSPFVSDPDVFAAIRVQDTDNYYGINIAGTGPAGLRLNSVLGGAEDDTLYQGQAVGGETYRIEDDGSELRLYSGSINGEGGTLLHTEVTTALATETGKGFINRGGSSSSSPQFDQYKSGTLGAAPTGSIDADDVISQKVWQRNDSDNASVTLTGTYAGSPSNIERSIDGGAFAVAVTSPTGGFFSDTFDLSVGEHTVVYRFSNDTSVTSSPNSVVVGDIFVCAGQSNMSGRGINNQTFTDSAGGVTAYMLGNDDVFKPLQDPYDSSSGQVDAVSVDAAGGSWIVRFANQWLANNEVPPIFIPCAKGGTSIAEWSRSTSASTLYGSMKRRVELVGGVCATVLWEQGERDSKNDVNTSGSVYQAALEQLATDVNNDFSVGLFVVPLHTLTAAGYDNQDVIRQAQIDAAEASPLITIAQPLTDIDLSSGDGLHFQTDEQIETVAQRVYQSFTGELSAITFNIGAPDGTYKTYLIDQSDSVVYNANATFSGGAATLTGLPIAAGAELKGFVIDNEVPHVNGAVVTGVTV